MNLLYVLLFVAVFDCAHGQASLDDCPPDLNRDEFLQTFGEKCYRFELGAKKSYDVANSGCNQNGGSLVTIKDQATQDFVVNTMVNVYNNRHKIWIGLNDRQTPGDLIWEDGTPMNFSNFDPHHHDHANEHCASLEPGHHNNRWELNDCNKGKEYVCEYNITIATTPSPAVSPCPAHYVDSPFAVEYEGSCYRLDHTIRTYEDALSDCKSEGGSLAMPKTRHLDEYIKTFVSDHFNPLTKIWIGLNDENRTGLFEWSDGELVGYHNFATVTTEAGMESCVVLSLKDNGQWVDEACISVHPYVCQYNEELSTMWTTGAPTSPGPTTPAPDTPDSTTPVPDSTAPDTTEPDTTAPDTTAPDTPTPSASGSSTSAPDNAEMSTTAPGISVVVVSGQTTNAPIL